MKDIELKIEIRFGNVMTMTRSMDVESDGEYISKILEGLLRLQADLIHDVVSKYIEELESEYEDY